MKLQRSGAWSLLTASLFLSIAWGCGEGPPSVSSSSEEVQVRGTVTYKGKAYLKGKVQFETANVNRPHAPAFTYDVQNDGTYSGTSYIGENGVSVLAPPSSKSEFPLNRKEVVLTAGENVIDIAIP